PGGAGAAGGSSGAPWVQEVSPAAAQGARRGQGSSGAWRQERFVDVIPPSRDVKHQSARFAAPRDVAPPRPEVEIRLGGSPQAGAAAPPQRWARAGAEDGAGTPLTPGGGTASPRRRAWSRAPGLPAQYRPATKTAPTTTLPSVARPRLYQ